MSTNIRQEVLFQNNVPFVVSALSNQDTVFPELTNSTKLRHAYSSVLTVTMASDQSFYEAFRQGQITREIRSAVTATQVNLQQVEQRVLIKNLISNKTSNSEILHNWFHHTGIPDQFCPESCLQVSPFFGTIFNMVYFVAKAVEERRQAGGGRWVTGDKIIQSEGGFDFQGFNQVRNTKAKV